MDFFEALDIVNSNGIDLLTSPNSNLSAVAVTAKDGGPIFGATDFSVTAFVPQKLSQSEMEDSRTISFKEVFAQTVGYEPREYDIDIIESGSHFEPLIGLSVPSTERGRYGGNPPALNAQKWFKSLRAGIGIINPQDSYPNSLSVGTIGFFMKNDNNDQFLVSNNHVIGRSNFALSGEPVVQPGTLDLTGIEMELMPDINDLIMNIKVAEVAAIVEIKFKDPSATYHNRVDAALAKLTNSDRDLSNLARLTFGGSILGVSDLSYAIDYNTGELLGPSIVYKVGRTTGYTEGIITAIGATSTIKYGPQEAFFVDQLIVQNTQDNVGPFSKPGDSGSGILNEKHELVGLLFAGSMNQTLINPINEVINQLETESQQNLSVIIAA